MLNCYDFLIKEPHKKLTRQEKDIYRAWLEGNYKKSHLQTLSGESVSIVSPGKRNELEGPDFYDAMVIIGDQLLRGKVEIHRLNREWYEHGHHQDDNYNDVVLHVVTHSQKEQDIITANHKKLPVLVLEDYDIPPLKYKPCQDWAEVNRTAVLSLMDEYGTRRFNRKSLILKSDITEQDAEQVLYAGLLDVLGYSKNRPAFAQLAQNLPLKQVFQILDELGEDNKIPGLEAIYLGVAGLLTEENKKYFSTQRYYQEIEDMWSSLSAGYNLEKLSDINWHFVKSRPANHPPLRILSLVQILNNFWPNKPAATWISFISRKPEIEKLRNWVEQYFQKPAGLWQNHPLLPKQNRRKLMGNSRCRDLLSNYLLPFARANAILQRDDVMADYLVSVSKKVKRGAVPGIIRKMLGRFNMKSSDVENNNVLQGCIEFYRNWCDMDLCKLCPVREYAN